MPTHRLGPNDALDFAHQPPAAPDGLTFVFFNALTGDAASWDAVIGPALRARGHGTLLWNFRGQPNSPCADPASITAGGIVADAVSLLAAARAAGLDPMASHLYVLYWGIVSFITPPVALAAIAAASIAKSSATRSASENRGLVEYS